MAASRMLIGLALAVLAAGGVYGLQESSSSKHYTGTEGPGLTLEQQNPDLTPPPDTGGHTAGALVPEGPGPASHIPAAPAPVEAPPPPPPPVAASRNPAGGPQDPASGVQPNSTGSGVSGFSVQPGLPDVSGLSNLLNALPIYNGCLANGLPVLCPGQTPLPAPTP